MKHSTLILGLCLLAVGCGEGGDSRTSDAPDRDNTAVNDRDATDGTKTPFDQSNDENDIDLVANIRAEVLDIDDLSTYGKNVKIITDDNRVTLRGPVASAAEKDAIEQVAKRQAGAENVTSELEVTKD